MEAAMRLMNETEPSDLKCGTLVVVPIVNTVAFEAEEVNANPIDNLNLNRVFPGDPNGTISHHLARKLLELARKADYAVDLHGGDKSERLPPFTIWHKTGEPEIDEKAERIAHLFNTEFIWLMEDLAYGGTFLDQLAQMGRPAVISEAGKLGTYQESDIQVHVKGLENVMRYLGLKEGEPEVPPGLEQKQLTAFWTVVSGRGGIVYPYAEPGDRVTEGQVLGVIKNIHGEVLEELRCPADGWVRVHFPRRLVNTGSPIYRGWLDAE
jgi:predicted deacylase